MSLIQRVWNIQGTLHNVDGSAFNRGRILAYHLFPSNGWQQIAESYIDPATGAFELIFSTANFQEPDSETEFPTLQIRVTDYNYNPFWTSNIYSMPDTEMDLGDIIVESNINSLWNVCGNVCYTKNTPFVNGYVKLFDVRNSQERELGSCQLNSTGFYSINYTKEQFQQGDFSITSPSLLVRVYSSNGVNIANMVGPNIASAREFINIQVNSETSVIQGNQCKVFGSVTNKLGKPLSDITITAYCLHYDIIENGENATGTFHHQQIGSVTTTDSNGKYSIPYQPETLPQGLLLDAAEAYGKDKVSLYAKLEIYEKGANDPKTTVFKPLVFNGKSEQQIDFELDILSTGDNRSLFEELEDLLSIYRETVVRGSTCLTDKRNKINDFLKNVDEFTLVVGRERRTDKEVKAYFLAYSLYYGLFGRLNKKEDDDSSRIYAQGIFALTYQELVENLDELVNIQAPTLQTAIFDGITQNQISSKIKADKILKLWKEGIESSTVVEEMDDQFSPYHVFFLFVKGDLPLKKVDDAPEKTARVDLSGLTNDESQKIQFLMDAYYSAGSNYREMLLNLEDVAPSEWEVKDDQGEVVSNTFSHVKLQLLIDLCDFGEWYGDFVIEAYKYSLSHLQDGCELKNLLSFKEKDWKDIVKEVSQRYNKYYPNDQLGLPHEFTGTTAEEQIILYVKKLMDLIILWFPQYNLYNKLASKLPSAWNSLWKVLKTPQWEGFSLTDHDSKKYESEHIYAATIVGNDLDHLHILQRIFRLTNDTDAVAYLINNGFESATSIAELDEDYFVAEHALGIGTKEKATQIHRVAKSFVAEATFKIGQFHRNLNETDSMLKATSRGVSEQLQVQAARLLKKNAVATNTALPRIPASIAPTWKNLFGNINRNGATEGQSVLSASAYFVDLLNFFKANKDPYDKFLKRRPDLLNLQLTKANAEMAMPTIDLINEILESLVGGDRNRTATIVANQTPTDATTESLRAEPLNWPNGSEGKERQTKANLKLMSHAYPAMLPINTYRTKTTKLLGNVPLTLYNIAEGLGRTSEDKVCLFADELLHRILFKETLNKPWEFWGLAEKKNNVYLPDKSEYKMDDPKHPTPYLKDKTWIEILSHVAILLDRAGISFKELKEIISLPLFAKYKVEYCCPDALQYQLADINGYILIDSSVVADKKDASGKTIVYYPTEEFFTELASVLRFHRLLGWSYKDITSRYDELNRRATEEGTPENTEFPYSNDPIDNWDRIQEMVLRFGITPLNSFAWHGFALTEGELATVFDVPVLFERYREQPIKLEDPPKIEKYDDEYIENDIAKAAANCLSLKKEDVLYFLEQSGIFTGASINEIQEQHKKFLNGLNYVYRYGTFAQKHNLAANELYLLQDAGLGSLDDVREFSKAIRKCQGSSLPISVIEDLIRKPDDSVAKKAEAFMGDRGSLCTSIAESWEAVKVDEEKELKGYPEEINSLQQDAESGNTQETQNDEEINETELDPYAENIIAYKDSCSKILLSLEYVDVPYIDQLSQKTLPVDTDSHTPRMDLENWLSEVLKGDEEIIDDVLDEQKTPIQRIYQFHGYLKSVWIEEQVYTVLSQEFGIATDKKAQDAFKVLLLKIPAAAINVWTSLVKNTLWPGSQPSAVIDDIENIDYVAYYALYKANILYQYVSDYVLNSVDAETGLALGFGWNSWNRLFNYQIIDKDERLYLLSNITPYPVLEPLIEAYSVSDAFGNKEYSYAVIPPIDKDSPSTPIENLLQLKRLLLIPQSVFAECYKYAFNIELAENINTWGQIEIENWSETGRWFRFFKVYQLYLKTFTTPDVLENLFIELKESQLNIEDSAFKKLSEAVQTLNDNLHSNYSIPQWNKFIQGVSDEIRKERRDALAGFICWESQTTPNKYPQSFLNTNNLYAYYLIDVLMEPDMSMSRIVQANACLQLFVQRCQLGLEGQTIDGANLFSDSALAQWEWMKNYQVWVANRKVFLYPENWLDVSLRDDKSSFFIELEENLQEVGGDSSDMESIYAEYLEKMRETANLEIVGCCKEDGDSNGETVYTLHIIGRTRGEPHRYYYRKYFAKKMTRGTWSPWDIIEADITGDIVFPQLMNGRLYLIWPQYTQGQRQLNSGSMSEEGVSVPQLEFYVEIKMAWTCFNGKKWTGVKATKNALYDVSNDTLDFKLEKDEKIADWYHLKLSQDNGCININVYRTLIDQFLVDDYQNLANHCWEQYEKTQNEYYKNEARMYEAFYKDGLNKEKTSRKIKVTEETSVKQFIVNRFRGDVLSQKISSIGVIAISNEGRDSAVSSSSYKRICDIKRNGDSRGTPIRFFSPKATYLKHNYWLSNGKKSLVYKDAKILSAHNDFQILPVNMDFYDPEDELGHVSNLPFFYMDSVNTYFVCPKANEENKRIYEFILMSHPIADEFFNQYRNGGKKELHTRGIQALEKVQSYYTMYSGYNYYFGSAIGYHIAGDWAAWDMGQSFFESNYNPTDYVAKPYPAPYVDFSWNSPNGIYNWELFFYVPVRIADKLIAEEKYEAALEWLQLVFDPQSKKEGPEKIARWADDLPSGAQYWRFLPFYANPDADKTILESLSALEDSINTERKIYNV